MAIAYRPGGLKKGTRLKMPSTSTGNPMARLTNSGVEVWPFHVLNHGPPPTSKAAILLVTSNTFCNSSMTVRNHENAPKRSNDTATK